MITWDELLSAPSRPAAATPRPTPSDDSPSQLKRARAYVDRMPAAISGQNGHTATFNVARVCAQDFGLSEADTLTVLHEFNARCEPPWSEVELRHKVTSAMQAHTAAPKPDREPPAMKKTGRKNPPPADEHFDEYDTWDVHDGDGSDDGDDAPNVVAMPLSRGDHVELGQRLRLVMDRDGRTVHAEGRTYQYRAPVFERVSNDELSNRLQKFAGLRVAGKKDPLKVKHSDVKGAVYLYQDTITRKRFFDDAPAGIAFADCFVQVSADGITKRANSEENRARFAYEFDYVDDPTPRRFLAFLRDVWRDDDDAAEKIACLQEFGGACLVGVATQFQRAIVAVGAGANGKSVAGQILAASMPPGSISSIAPQDLGQEYRLALIAGKRLNLVNELPEADILDSEAFKSVISGDLKTARHIREAPFEFSPTAGHWMAANRLPGSADQTHGFWRRFLMLTFNRIFALSEQDPQLADRIIATELPHIVSWLLHGAVRVLRQNGYTEPASSCKAKEDWRRMADQVAAFVDDRVTLLPPDTAHHVRAIDLYRAYRHWSLENGHRPLASNKFGARMKALEIPWKRTKAGAVYSVCLKFDQDDID